MDYKELDQHVYKYGFDNKKSSSYHNHSEQELMEEIEKEQEINALWQSFMK